MIIAVAGYNASGKSTLSCELVARLEASGVSCKLVKFDKLYPAAHFTKRPKRKAVVRGDQSVGLRAVEGQPGKWNQPFRWKHFVNVVGAGLSVWLLRLVCYRRVVVFDRHFCDRLINFDASSLLYRLARKLTPSPTAIFVLLPDQSAWEKRMLARLEKRFDLTLQRLSDSDRDELTFVRNQYERVVAEEARAIAIDSSTSAGTEVAWQHLTEHLRKAGHTTESPELS